MRLALVLVVAMATGASAEPARKRAPAPRWSVRRPVAKPPRVVSPPVVTLAALHTKGLSAYQAGRYDSAIVNFAAALDTTPSAALVYHAAQAYRLKGDRAKALELYEQYLELAPHGPAANACRAQIEKLRDAPMPESRGQRFKAGLEY